MLIEKAYNKIENENFSDSFIGKCYSCRRLPAAWIPLDVWPHQLTIRQAEDNQTRRQWHGSVISQENVSTTGQTTRAAALNMMKCAEIDFESFDAKNDEYLNKDISEGMQLLWKQ